MQSKNWYVKVYGKDNSIIDEWPIDNRTEFEALSEAMAEIDQISQSNDNYYTWTMETY